MRPVRFSPARRERPSLICTSRPVLRFSTRFPIARGGGAICGKDPHKVDVAGAFRARELARRLLKERGGSAVTVRLGWTPGDAAPAFREAERIDSLGVAHAIPSEDLPLEEWFSIGATVADLRLTSLSRRTRVLSGYFFGVG